MALNRPAAPELIEALRGFLENNVAPQVDGATRFHLRVADNVLAIIARELAQRGPAEAAEIEGLRGLLDGKEAGADASLQDLNAILITQIRAGRFDPPDARRALFAHLRATTAAKLAIDNPKYAGGALK